MKLSPNINEMLRAFLERRKKGYIFESDDKKPLTLRHFEKKLNSYAKLLSIQKDKQITSTGRVYRLVTLMALREAGEKHHDNAGGSRKLLAVAAGHTMAVKELHYEKGREALNRCMRA